MAPTVIQRSSSSKVMSRRVIAQGSSKTRTAVSNRTSCLRRFWRFLFSSQVNRIAAGDTLAYQVRSANVNTFVRTLHVGCSSHAAFWNLLDGFSANLRKIESLGGLLQSGASETARVNASRGFPRFAPGLNQHICRNAEFVMQLADHIQGQRTLAPEHLVDPRALANHPDQCPRILSFLFEPEFDGFHRVRQV